VARITHGHYQTSTLFSGMRWNGPCTPGVFDGPMIVEGVTAGSEAERAGLQTGDTILEINGKTVGQESAQDVEALNSGETIAVKIHIRSGSDRELKWKVGSREEVAYYLKDLESVTAEQRARRAAWLKGESQASAH
jgi:predicted metalloprotease with PDZ domain